MIKFRNGFMVFIFLFSALTFAQKTKKANEKTVEKVVNTSEKQEILAVPLVVKTNLFPMINDGKWGFINFEGLEVIPPQFDVAEVFSDGLALVKFSGKWGYVDKEGKYAINPQFESGKEFSELFAAVKSKGKWGFIDKKGDFIVRPIFSDAKSFSSGLAAVKENGVLLIKREK